MTINQIGIAALTRLLSKKKLLPTVETESRYTFIRQGDAPLWEHCSVVGYSFEDNVNIEDGVAYWVWGIELGFKQLASNPKQPAMVCLINLLEQNDWNIPSHIVRVHWIKSSNKSQNLINHEVYRLSQDQEAKLKSMQPSQALTTA